jgi:hypothetical protein
MPIYTGKSKDGWDMHEAQGMYMSPDGKHWGSEPFTYEQAQHDRANKVIEGKYEAIRQYLKRYDISIYQAYDEVLEKKSKLSCKLRNFVLNLLK